MEQPEDFDQLWNYDDPAGTEKKFRDLLARSGDAPPAYRLGLMTQLARSIGLQRRFDEAHALLDQVQQSLDPEMKLQRVRLLLEKGRVINSSGNRPASRSWFRDAFELAGSERFDFFAVDAAHMLGIVEESPAEQLRWHQNALVLAERSDDPRARKWAGSLYNNMGWTHFEQKEYDQALELFQSGVAFRAAANQPRELRIARYTVARTFRAMGRIDEAYTLMKQLSNEAATINEQDGYFDEELAECLLALGKADAARPLFARAHALLSKDSWLAKHEAERLSRLKQLGE